VHGDLCGPVMPATPGGRRFLLLVDDATRFMWVSLLTAKSATVDAIKRVQAEAEKVCGRKLRVLRTETAGNSPPQSSPTTAPTKASRAITPLPIRLSRTAW